MSAVTRARRNDVVTFKDKAGHVVNGVALEFRSDSMLVGVQSAEKPYVFVAGQRADGTAYTKRVPNNAIWAVPYTAIMATSMPEAG